jgi:hypothetical protein
MNEELIYNFHESLVECGMLCYLDNKCNGIKFTENEEKRCTTMILVEFTSPNFGESLRIFEQCWRSNMILKQIAWLCTSTLFNAIQMI